MSFRDITESISHRVEQLQQDSPEREVMAVDCEPSVRMPSSSRRIILLVLGSVALVVIGVLALRSCSADSSPALESSTADLATYSDHTDTPVVAEPATLIVSIQGMVAEPGLVEVDDPGVRIGQVFERVGGLLDGADIHQLNLAQTLSDGMQIVVNDQGSEIIGTNHVQGQAAVPGSAGDSGGLININTASESELETVSGIGPKTAQSIIEYRSKIGTFSSVEQLLEVSGIGPAKLEKMRESLTV